jgi:O-antigen/teichoic acid export membrane protein
MTNMWNRWRGTFRDPRSPLASKTRRQGCANSFYGVADYLVWPIGMLLAAPFLLKHLGTSQYGIWILAGAAVSSGGMVSGSFGDAVIKYVGDCRARADWRGVTRIVRNMISINVMLSGILAIALWYLAPCLSRQVVKTHFELQAICLQSLRIGSVLLVMKAIESVFISTLRAVETYGSTVRISICSRIAILAVAIVLASSGHTVVSIMVATSFITAVGTLGNSRFSVQSGRPALCWTFDRRTSRSLLRSLCSGCTTDSRLDLLRNAFPIPTSQFPLPCCTSIRDTTKDNTGV